MNKLNNMKIEKITPQIAALYLGQECSYKRAEGENTSVFTISALTIKDISFSFMVAIPHLRRLESITEDEARELYEIKYLEKWGDIESSSLEYFWREDVELYAPEGKLLIGTPTVWLYLLSKGFDLFGLIEAGLAKDVLTCRATAKVAP